MNPQSVLVLGAPIFNNEPRILSLNAPYAHIQLYKSFRQISSAKELTLQLAQEYMTVLLSLHVMGIDFKVAWGYEQFILPGVREKLSEELGISFVRLPGADPSSLAWPRDFAYQLPGLVLINSKCDPLVTVVPSRYQGRRTVFSTFGEGGRILFRKGTVLIPDQSWDITKGRLVPSNSYVFEKVGIKVGKVPVPVIYENSEGMEGTVPDDHLDRSAGLLEDTKGQLHLIVDPEVCSGFLGPKASPIHGPHETLKQYRKVCSQLSITVHVLSKLTVPGVFNFMQFADGRVLMSGGDEEMASLVSDLVGADKLILTPQPMTSHAVWCKSGIRCVIGELPAWLTTPA